VSDSTIVAGAPFTSLPQTKRTAAGLAWAEAAIAVKRVATPDVLRRAKPRKMCCFFIMMFPKTKPRMNNFTAKEQKKV
jgi:hypothetical protein